MTQCPLVSISCLTYNHAPYLRQCLDGFVMQITSFPIEILIYDDASGDGTQNIIEEYQKKYPDIIKPIYQTENQYSKGVKVGFVYNYSRAKGEYIAFCEGDDYWIDPLKLQRQVDFLEGNPEYVLTYTGAYIVNANSEKQRWRYFLQKRYSGDVTKYLFCKGSFIITAKTCYRSDYIAEFTHEKSMIPFPLKMGDLPLWLFLSLKGKFKYIDEKTTCYRILPQSASHFKEREKRIEYILNCQDVLFYFNSRFKLGISESVIHKLIHKRLIRNMASFDRVTFCSYYKKGIKQCPSLLFDIRTVMTFVVRMVLNQKY